MGLRYGGKCGLTSFQQLFLLIDDFLNGKWKWGLDLIAPIVLDVHNDLLNAVYTLDRVPM